MLRVKVICAGRLREQYFEKACSEYEKRLSSMCRLEIKQVEERANALLKEAEDIEKHIPRGAFIVPLCIEGQEISSEGLAEKISGLMARGTSEICFIIGSSEGLHSRIKDMGDFKLSMSPMTFPHHLARVMLLEQIYRALSINSGGKYHK